MRLSLPSIKCSATPFSLRLLPSTRKRRCGNQIVEHSSDNETVLGSSQKLRGTAEHLTDGSDKRISWLNPVELYVIRSKNQGVKI